MNADQACRQAARCSEVLLTLILLPGCAEFLAAREQTVEGWREARVVQIAAGESIAHASPRDCRAEAAPDTAATGRYAVYQY